jgi:hypothetical protein
LRTPLAQLTTGPNIELSALRVALLAGVSAAALFAAGAANAQTQTPPTVNGTTDQTYVVGSTGHGPFPTGVDLSQPAVSSALSSIGAAGPTSTQNQVLEYTSNGALVPTTVALNTVLNADGTPIKNTYATEINAFHVYTPTGTPVIQGTGANAGEILVNASNGAPVDHNFLLGQDPAAAAISGYKWVTASSVDTSPSATNVVKWVPATYGSDPSLYNALHAPHGWIATDGNGAGVTQAQFQTAISGLTLAQKGVLFADLQNNNLAALNAQLKADGVNVVFESATANDPALTKSTLYNYTGLVASPQGQVMAPCPQTSAQLLRLRALRVRLSTPTTSSSSRRSPRTA